MYMRRKDSARKDRSTDILPTRMTLLQRAQLSQDAGVWNELLRYYEPFIRKILLRMGLRGADFKDAQQEVLLKLWKGLSCYKRDEKHARFRNWLSTLIRNAAIDWIKKQRHNRHKLPLNEEVQNALHPEQPEAERIIEKEWQRHIVELAMEHLKDVFSGNAFEVFALSLKGMSGKKIAAQLGIRKESVYVLRSRVKVRLRQEITRLRMELEGGCVDE